ncbi:PGPGW domain-containing protein [Cellulomonas sp. URHE0023]|uniref:PGPGW domain-containing protein n=1 Tax=Cellulomonas sp. URHE0023 TaxID=1380354 RepID=UPI0009DF47AB|nr:PGPGW domain-containing protein [Cellulomonas sp. URHE0023]
MSETPSVPDAQSEQTPDEHESGRFAAVNRTLDRLPHPVRVVGVALFGGVLVLAGLAMLVLPGPGIVVILAGLAVLASEFVWARRILDRTKAAAKAGLDKGKAAVKRKS